jgi:hypothetical protein
MSIWEKTLLDNTLWRRNFFLEKYTLEKHFLEKCIFENTLDQMRRLGKFNRFLPFIFIFPYIDQEYWLGWRSHQYRRLIDPTWEAIRAKTWSEECQQKGQHLQAGQSLTFREGLKWDEMCITSHLKDFYQP